MTDIETTHRRVRVGRLEGGGSVEVTDHEDGVEVVVHRFGSPPTSLYLRTDWARVLYHALGDYLTDPRTYKAKEKS